MNAKEGIAKTPDYGPPNVLGENALKAVGAE